MYLLRHVLSLSCLKKEKKATGLAPPLPTAAMIMMIQEPQKFRVGSESGVTSERSRDQEGGKEGAVKMCVTVCM